MGQRGLSFLSFPNDLDSSGSQKPLQRFKRDLQSLGFAKLCEDPWNGMSQEEERGVRVGPDLQKETWKHVVPNRAGGVVCPHGGSLPLENADTVMELPKCQSTSQFCHGQEF